MPCQCKPIPNPNKARKSVVENSTRDIQNCPGFRGLSQDLLLLYGAGEILCWKIGIKSCVTKRLGENEKAIKMVESFLLKHLM